MLRTPRVFTHTEGRTRASAWARMRRSAGVHRPWHAGRETSKHVGGPKGSCEWEASAYGIRLLRHGRGNPETDLCRNLSCDVKSPSGRRRSTVKGKSRRMPLGSRIERSTRRWGKPTTWGRSRREHVTRKGNSFRTRWAGQNEPTSLRGLAHRAWSATAMACAEASATEEPDAGTLHVRVCAGASGNRRPYRGGRVQGLICLLALRYDKR